MDEALQPQIEEIVRRAVETTNFWVKNHQGEIPPVFIVSEWQMRLLRMSNKGHDVDVTRKPNTLRGIPLLVAGDDWKPTPELRYTDLRDRV